ncbi:hypothetical protein FGADI_984 [Fusarium gaditjirri]|uniref:Uncharacterized protein n=1 Tax=Fusarium gaditjirri TaxID=282569 RepID=A0A8H4TM11_9HYPO|nr:hypothetical protein FGADI_984 [Fusarium gaditjirri]
MTFHHQNVSLPRLEIFRFAESTAFVSVCLLSRAGKHWASPAHDRDLNGTFYPNITQDLTCALSRARIVIATTPATGQDDIIQKAHELTMEVAAEFGFTKMEGMLEAFKRDYRVDGRSLESFGLPTKATKEQIPAIFNAAASPV